MGDQHERAAEIAVEGHDEVDDLFARRGIQIARGLVGEQERWPPRHRAGHRHPLLLSAGKLDGIVMPPLGQPHIVEQGARPLHRARLAAELERHGHVLEGAQGRDEVKGLEHVADGVATEAGQLVFAKRRDLDAPHRDVTGRGAVEARDEAEQSGLSAARRTGDGHELPRGHLQRDVGEHVHGAAAAVEAHGEPAHGDHDAAILH